MSTRKPAPTVDTYAKVNAECARIILDDPLKYPPDGFLAMWAKEWVKKEDKEQAK